MYFLSTSRSFDLHERRSGRAAWLRSAAWRIGPFIAYILAITTPIVAAQVVPTPADDALREERIIQLMSSVTDSTRSEVIHDVAALGTRATEVVGAWGAGMGVTELQQVVAVEALGLIGGPGAVARLFDIAADSSVALGVRALAASAIASVDPSAFGVHWDAVLMDPVLATIAADAATRDVTVAGAGQLAQLLASDMSELFPFVIEALERQGPGEESMAALERAADRAGPGAISAASLLAAWGRVGHLASRWPTLTLVERLDSIRTLTRAESAQQSFALVERLVVAAPLSREERDLLWLEWAASASPRGVPREATRPVEDIVGVILAEGVQRSEPPAGDDVRRLAAVAWAAEPTQRQVLRTVLRKPGDEWDYARRRLLACAAPAAVAEVLREELVGGAGEVSSVLEELVERVLRGDDAAREALSSHVSERRDLGEGPVVQAVRWVLAREPGEVAVFSASPAFVPIGYAAQGGVADVFWALLAEREWSESTRLVVERLARLDSGEAAVLQALAVHGDEAVLDCLSGWPLERVAASAAVRGSRRWMGVFEAHARVSLEQRTWSIRALGHMRQQEVCFTLRSLGASSEEDHRRDVHRAYRWCASVGEVLLESTIADLHSLDTRSVVAAFVPLSETSGGVSALLAVLERSAELPRFVLEDFDVELASSPAPVLREAQRWFGQQPAAMGALPRWASRTAEALSLVPPAVGDATPFSAASSPQCTKLREQLGMDERRGVFSKCESWARDRRRECARWLDACGGPEDVDRLWDWWRWRTRATPAADVRGALQRLGRHAGAALDVEPARPATGL